MPLLQTNLEGDYLPQWFHCTSDKPGSLLLLAFSEIQPSLFTPVSSSLPVLMILYFNSQSALDLKSDWPELLPSSVMRKREELWGRDWTPIVVSLYCVTVMRTRVSEVESMKDYCILLLENK